MSTVRIKNRANGHEEDISTKLWDDMQVVKEGQSFSLASLFTIVEQPQKPTEVKEAAKSKKD